MNAPQHSLCVVLHDVAPATWSSCQWLIDRLAETAEGPVTLLAVPRYHGGPRNRGFERWLRARAEHGDELALHGFSHLDEGTPRDPLDRLRRRVYTRGEAEFWDLGFEQATQRLKAGRAWLGELGVRPRGFVAPAWLLGADAWRALRREPFDYTCSLRRIYLLGSADPRAPLREIICQSQVYSSASGWRRGLSVAWNESLMRLQQDAPLVRLELHPGDDVPLVHRSWQRLLREQTRTRRLCTLGCVVDEFSDQFRTAPVPLSP